MKRSVLFTATLLILSAPRLSAGDSQHALAPYAGTHELQTLKTLVGHWEGTSDKPANEGDKITLDYRITSGGTAVVETLMAGTPHEMTSVYTDEDGKLAMTHYCIMGNQPHLTQVSSSDRQIALAVGKNGNVNPQTAHMHALTLEFPSENTLVQKWTSYEGGRPKDTMTFTFTRKA
jgi:hypothetical protein